MRLNRRKVILGTIVLVVAVCIAEVGASLLIGRIAGREVSRQLGDSIAKALLK
jgi:hypothetical protein